MRLLCPKRPHLSYVEGTGFFCGVRPPEHHKHLTRACGSPRVLSSWDPVKMLPNPRQDEREQTGLSA